MVAYQTPGTELCKPIAQMSARHLNPSIMFPKTQTPPVDVPFLIPYDHMSAMLSLHRLPKIIRIEVFRKLRVDVHYMDIPLFGVANGRLIVVSCLILLQSYPQRSVKP